MANTLSRSSQILTARKEIRRLVQFGVVGVIGTLLDFGLLVLLKEVVGLTTGVANLMSYGAGIVNNYALNRLWTYADSERKPLAQFGQFALISLGGLLLNTGIVVGVEGLLAEWAYGYLIAKVAATGVVFVWNFVLNRLWTFNDVE